MGDLSWGSPKAAYRQPTIFKRIRAGSHPRAIADHSAYHRIVQNYECCRWLGLIPVACRLLMHDERTASFDDKMQEGERQQCRRERSLICVEYRQSDRADIAAIHSGALDHQNRTFSHAAIIDVSWAGADRQLVDRHGPQAAPFVIKLSYHSRRHNLPIKFRNLTAKRPHPSLLGVRERAIGLRNLTDSRRCLDFGGSAARFDLGPLLI